MNFLLLAALCLFIIITAAVLQKWWRRKTGNLLPEEEPPVVIGELKSKMDQFARPSLMIRKTSTNTKSWIGGSPPNSAGFVWPRRKGKPLAFIASLDLSESRHTIEWLPKKGRIMFFYDLAEQPWGFDPDDRDGHVVLYLPDPETIQNDEVGFPDDLQKDFRLPKHHVKLVPAQTWPSPLSEVVSTLNLGSKSFDAWCDEKSKSYDDSPHHQMGGWPDAVQSPDMEMECQLASNQVYVGNPEGYQSEEAKKHAPGAADWSLLLQIDSDEELDIMWGDCGMIYFWVRRQDAQAGDFSKTWLVLQCC